jgi:amino-acid N-acetyltransferase
MEIRNAVPGDFATLRHLLGDGVREGTLQPRSRREMRQNLSGFVVAEDEGQIVGMASVVPYSRRIAEVRSLYVLPTHRRNGIAADLVRSVTERSVSVLPSAIVFAITQTPNVFESDGYSQQQGRRSIVFKNI